MGIKIGIVSEYFYPVVAGGGELFLKALSEYLVQEGFEVVVFASEQDQVGESPYRTYRIKSSPFRIPHYHGVPGIRYYQLPGITTPWMYLNLPLRRRLAEIYRREKLDLLHINALPHLSYAPLQAAGDIPVVLHPHDYFPICFIRDFSFCNREPYYNHSLLRCAYCLSWRITPPRLAQYFAPLFTAALLPSLFLERWMREKYLKIPQAIVCDSDFVATVLANHGYPAKVIPTPYLKEIELYPREESRDSTFRILFVGRLEWRKGVDSLIDVAKGLQGKANFRIDVVGTGYRSAALDRQDLNIFLHGYLGEERFELFKKADCLVAPSRWPEPLGMVAQEAMVHGVPVVTLASSGGLAELVRENGVGLLADGPEDLPRQVLHLYEHPELYRTFRQNAAESIWRYDKNTVFAQFKDLFLSVAQQRRGQR